MNKHRVFIGSSREAMSYVDAIHDRLSHTCEVTPWHAGVFREQRYPMEDLEKQIKTSDFAVFVFSPDDLIKIRGKSYFVSRDNTLFEMGLFWGRLRRERVFFIIPNQIPESNSSENYDYHLASDLNGLTTLTYEANRSDNNHEAAVNIACKRVIESIERLKGFEKPEVIISTLRSVVNFYREFTRDILKYETGRFDPLIEAIRNSYDSRAFEFQVEGAAIWQVDKAELVQVAGNVGKKRRYSLDVNDSLKEGEPEIVVVKAFHSKEVAFIDISIGFVNKYVLCYPAGENHVISIHISGYSELSELQLEDLYKTNEGLMGIVNNLFGGVWS